MFWRSIAVLGSAFALAGMAFGCANSDCRDSVSDAAHGYRLVSREERSSAAFESISHYEDLYLGIARIGVAVDHFSPSPSGRFAFFVERGRLKLFDRLVGYTRDVTDSDFASPNEVKWTEKEREVSVTYYGSHPLSRIATDVR